MLPRWHKNAVSTRSTSDALAALLANLLAARRSVNVLRPLTDRCDRGAAA